MHSGTICGVEFPALLHDAPQFRTDLERPIECAVTMVDDLDDAPSGMKFRIRWLAGKHLHNVS